MRARQLTFAAWILACACCAGGGGGPEGPAHRPAASARGYHLLLITVDTLRADRLGCYGHAGARTPAIDGLALTGLRFEQATAPAPITLPSHATILTGLDVPSHGVRHNGTFKLPEEHETLAEMLRMRGYLTAAFVGAYVLDSRYGLDQGFGHYDDAVHAHVAVEDGYNERPADEVTDAVLGWLERTNAGPSGPPFMIWAHYFDPHGPYEPPAAYADLDAYDGEVAFTDAEIGRLLGWLENEGLLDRTLVVFTSDHGEGLGDHGELTHADLIYESTMRVPLILSNPVLFPEAVTVADRVTGSVDIVPTVLDLLEIEPLPPGLDGRSALAAADPERAIYIETLAPLLDYGWAPLRGLRRVADKLILAPDPEYFDLRRDPGEQDNLYARGGPARTLQAALERRMQDDAVDEAVIASARTLDRDQLERLASLGYLSAGSVQVGVKDPKAMMPLWHRMNHAGRLSLQGEHAEAVEQIRAVLLEDPTSGKAWYTAATVYERAGSFAEAEACLRRAVELRPMAAGWVNLARLALRRGDVDEAERALSVAERLDPSEGGVHLGRGHVLASQGRFDQALREFERALELDPVKSGQAARKQIEAIRARER